MALSAEFLTTHRALLIVPTRDECISQRIEDDRIERLHRLANRAQRAGIQLELDTFQIGQYVASSNPGRCELVTPQDCTCHQFRIWGACEHNALLLRRLEGGKV
jgi:hypothetical protein